MEEYYASPLREQRKYANERHSYRGLGSRPGYYDKYDQQRQNMEQLEMDRKQRKRSKSRPKHCPSCHCISETMKHSAGRTKHSDNMEAVLAKYQNFLEGPNNQVRSCNCGHAMESDYHPPKSKETSSYQHPRKSAYDPTFLTTMENIATVGANDSDDSYRYRQSIPATVKNNYKRCGRKENQTLTRMSGSLDVDNEPTVNKSAQPRKERKASPEPRIRRQHAEKANRLNGGGSVRKFESKGNEDEYWLQGMKSDEVVRGKLRFDLPECNNPNNMNVEEDREEQTKRKLDGLWGGLSTAARSNGAMPTTIQAALKSRNMEELPKHKALTMGDSDCSKDEDTRKQPDNTRVCKSRQRSTIGRNSIGRRDEELVASREENQENACGEMVVKDDDQEAVMRKNVYAGGDLDLHATKSYILGVIDRALSNEFGSSIEQQKNADSNRELTQQEICIKITRDLLGSCCQVEDLLSHRGSRVDSIKDLRILWWKHMNHIQDEFSKLCSVQKCLDSFSPRQSMAVTQPHAAAVEQRPEDRQQQQQEEKQSLGTIP